MQQIVHAVQEGVLTLDISTLSIFLVSSMANGSTGGSVPVTTGRRSLSSSLFLARSSIVSFRANVFADTMNLFGLKEGGKLEREHVCAHDDPVDTHWWETCRGS